jgi:hypothetical protein
MRRRISHPLSCDPLLLISIAIPFFELMRDLLGHRVTAQKLLLETSRRRTRAMTGLSGRAGCQPAGAQGPAFVERRAVADLDHHA